MTNSNALAGLNILITRPKLQSLELAKLIEKQGGQAYVWPCLEILALADPSKIINAVNSLRQTDRVIFVSPNAVAYSFAALNQLQKQRLQQTCLIAIGVGTAKALEQQGCENIVFPEQADSEGLLALPILQEVAKQKVYIFRGQAGRELIANSLVAKAATIEYIESYIRQKPATDPLELIQSWHRQKFDMVVCCSTETLQNLLDSLGQEQSLMANTVLTVINEKMLHLATQIGAKPLSIDSAENSAILTCLKRFKHERL
ncbi:MAG: uroporphyrinogen synthase [Gammaproteobacteria bacterium]|nr:uroporphyrinogen synthase [Gammaproteobacteria bacterium]